MTESRFLSDLNEGEALRAAAYARALSDASGLVYKLDAGTFVREPHRAHILRAEEGVLTGYAYVAGLGRREAEATLIGESEAAYDDMYTALTAALPAHTETLTLIANRGDGALTGWLARRGFARSATEYRMAFDRRGFAPVRRAELTVRSAGAGDAAAIGELLALAFGYVHEPSARELASTRLAFLGGALAGTMRVDAHEGVYGIYGVVIAPALRGRGLGRAFMSAVLEELLAAGYEKIYLEVASDNDAAYRLYQSLGFATEAVMDYYPSAVTSEINRSPRSSKFLN